MDEYICRQTGSSIIRTGTNNWQHPMPMVLDINILNGHRYAPYVTAQWGFPPSPKRDLRHAKIHGLLSLSGLYFAEYIIYSQHSFPSSLLPSSLSLIYPSYLLLFSPLLLPVLLFNYPSAFICLPAWINPGLCSSSSYD